MKILRVIIPMFLCLAMINVNVGCGGQPKHDTDPDTLKVDSDSVRRNPNILSKRAQRPRSATLLFDASGSMQGYLNSIGESRFIGVISTLENIPDNTTIRFYGKKEEDPIDKDKFDSMLNYSKQIKWSDESDLKSMIKSMLGHLNSGDDVCILITDGILSGSHAEIVNSPDRSYNIKMREKMSSDISDMLSNKSGEISALVVRYVAKFNGRYSRYNDYGVTLVNKDRPFFTIVLGKWEGIKYIEDKLNEIKAQHSVGTPYEDIIMIGDASSYQNIKLSAAEGLNPKDGKFVIKGDYKQESITLSANLSNLPAYMQTDNYINNNIELYIQHANKAETPLNKDYFEVSVNKVNDENIMRLSIKSSSLANSKLTFKLKYAFPKWIELQSDDDDNDIATNPAELYKTFNLKYLVDGFKVLHKGKYIVEQSLDFK